MFEEHRHWAGGVDNICSNTTMKELGKSMVMDIVLQEDSIR
jgi:hypothetical protein